MWSIAMNGCPVHLAGRVTVVCDCGVQRLTRNATEPCCHDRVALLLGFRLPFRFQTPSNPRDYWSRRVLRGETNRHIIRLPSNANGTNPPNTQKATWRTSASP